MGSPATGRKISIWWDMESCPFPQNINSQSIARLSDVLLYRFRINGHVHQFCAYDNFDRVEERVKQTLGNSAIRLRHVPPGRKESVEKAMLVDILCWSIDESPPAILIFIVGDIDLSNTIHRLSQRTYGVFLVCYSAHQMAECMFAGVIEWVEWRVLLQSLPFVVFDSTRNVPCTNPTYFDPTGVIPYTESKFSLTTLTTFTRRWPSGVLIMGDNMPYIHTNAFPHRPNCEYGKACRPCQVPHDIYGQSESVSHSSRINQSSIKDRNIPVLSTVSYRDSNLEKASMDDVKSWLLQLFKNEHGRKGYPISLIFQEFMKANGKVLDLHYLGFPKLVKLLEEFKDVACLRSVSPSELLLFPVQTGFQREWKPEDIDSDLVRKPKEKSHNDINTRKNEIAAIEYKRQSAETSSREVINPSGRTLIKAKLNSRLVTRKYGGKAKASMDDLKMWLSGEVVSGCFRDGIEISKVYEKFEADTGKVIDLNHLGYSKLSKLLQNFKDIVTLNKNASSVKLFATLKDTDLTGTERASPVTKGDIILSKDSTKKVWRAVKPFSAVTERCMESYEVSGYSQEVDNKRSQASVLITEKYSRRYLEHLASPENRAVTSNSGHSDCKNASMDLLKSWLLDLMDREESRNGYPISRIYQDFQRSTGKYLNLRFLGFQKLSKLLEEFKDVGVLKRYSQSEIKLFPLRTSVQIIRGETDSVKHFSRENRIVSLSNVKGAWKRVEIPDNLPVLQTPRVCNGRLAAEITGISFDITSCSQWSTAMDSEIMRESLAESAKDICFSAETNGISFDITSCSQLSTATNSEIMRESLAESARDICLSAETNGISFDITSCSQLLTAADSEIMRESLGERAKDIIAMHPNHSITADEIFRFDDQTPRGESGENNVVAVDAGLRSSIRSISTGVEDLIVTPIISSPTAQQNQPFENAKMKKRHSHEIPRKGSSVSVEKKTGKEMKEWLVAEALAA